MMMTSTSAFRKAALVGTLSALIALGACSKPAEKTEAAAGATATQTEWGALSDGSKVQAVELKNSKGVTARVISYGATLQDLMVPDKDGKAADIVIGYDNIEGYEKTPNYTGVTVGRYANRIAGGKFTLDGKTYTLAKNNNGATALHGGVKGWDKRNWTVKDVKSGGDAASVTLQYVSPDGEEGYPGTVTAEVTYTLNENNDLTVSYKATTDKPTVVNMTNHSLFNLGGIPATRPATDATLKIESDAILAVDKVLIPNAELPVKGTPFDFNTPALISERITSNHPQIIVGNQGIDHNYIIRGGVTATPKLAVTLEDKTSGRGMTISTTEPGIQMYTGNFLDGTIAGKGGQKLTKYQAVAFEAQRYPDSPNQPKFPTTRLDPGQTYTQTTVHHFYTVK
jgi:aldose 1-epimerase